jgi:hypothetical protein
MAPRKRNKQDELNRTYRNADVGRVGSSLRNQGYSQSNKGNTYYTVGGVKYNAATGRPVRNQPKPAAKPAPKPAPKPQPAAAPRPAAVTSGGGGGSATPPASRPTSSAGKTSSNVGPVANGDDYARNKDPKKYNPLMQKTFGYQTGDAPDQRAAKEKFTGNDQTSYKPQAKVDGSKYEAGKAATNRTGDNNPDVASKATNKYLEEIKKKRQGQSNVIG